MRKRTNGKGTESREVIRNEPEHFTRLGMTTERLLGEHDRVIHGHFKHTAARRSQADFGLWPTIPQRGRQTDGPGLVVSDGAEFDCQAHGVGRGARSEKRGGRAKREERIVVKVRG